MPTLDSAIILRAWRQRSETRRIHYMISRANGDPRRCYADEGTALYKVLDEHLLAIGYTGPKSDEEH